MDSSLPDFWNQRYETNVVPWDAGRVPAALEQHTARFRPGARILIPGCGSAYELVYLSEKGFDAWAIDFSPAGVERARHAVKRFAERILLADFFTFEHSEPFDVLYERAFLCALPRRTWAAYAQHSARLLRGEGMLAGFFFFEGNPKGPPFGTSREELHALLNPFFERIEDEAVSDSIPIFEGKERWQTWRKKP